MFLIENRSVLKPMKLKPLLMLTESSRQKQIWSLQSTLAIRK